MISRLGPHESKCQLKNPKSADRGRQAVAVFLVAFLVSQAGLFLLVEFGPVGLRDPEYAAKERRLRCIRERTPSRPIVVAFGSSRLAGGLRPDVLPADERALFNFGLVGAAPVTQRLAIERLMRAGLRPSAVVLEFWPPYLLDFNNVREFDRLDPNRLNAADLSAISGYATDPTGLVWQLRTRRLAATFAHRFVLLNLLAHCWLPFEQRQAFRWRPVDEWGWLPSAESVPGDGARAARLAQARQYYEPFLTADRLDPIGEQAFADLLDFCADARIPAVLLWLPESSEFRSWYGPHTESLVQRRFEEWSRRPGVRGIDARAWLVDERLPDGFHLDRLGATEFTHRLAVALQSSSNCRDSREGETTASCESKRTGLSVHAGGQPWTRCCVISDIP